MSNKYDSSLKKILFDDINALMVKSGAISDEPYWRFKHDDIIVSLFVENYRASYLFYISIGIYALGLGGKKTNSPKISQMHMWSRLGCITQISTSTPQIILKEDMVEDGKKNICAVLSAIENVGLKMLERLSTLEGVKLVLEEYGEKRWTVQPILKEKLYGNGSITINGWLPLRDWEIAGSVNPFQK